MNPPPNDRSAADIGGMVVTYFPDRDFGLRLAAIARETNPVVVVDNSADETVRILLREICAAQGARLLENATNLGLGAALNQAVGALGESVEWAIAFDQDSMPEAGFSLASRRAAERFGNDMAAVGANWSDEARPGFGSRHLRRHAEFPWFFQRSEAREDLPDVTCVITSGTLFHLPTVRRLGGFAAPLFLDLVDTEFCLRARAAGRRVGVAAAARLQHRRGNKRPVAFCGVTFWPAFQPPSRLEGLFRNRVRLFRRYAWKFPHWALFELAFAAKILAEIIFLEDQKLAKLRACLRGTERGLVEREKAFVPLPHK